jgi:glucuronate isomerase
MRPFVHEDFLLESEVAVDLYHRFARDLPIVDYHCHLPVEQIRSNHGFRSLTEIWLDGDHYKWRAMRTNGVDERLCTGDAGDWEKFEAWAETVPATLRNPLHHWTHMELKAPFGIERLLDASSAREIYDACNEKLGQDGFRTQGLLASFRVAVVCTTDDPTDTLDHHVALGRREAPATRVYPAWRPDNALDVERPVAFNAWVDRLEAAADTAIGSLASFMAALEQRHEQFHRHGCRLSDHGVETLEAVDCTDRELSDLFASARGGTALSPGEARRYSGAMLHRFAVMDHTRGWVQQFHIGALRNANSRMLSRLGPNTGFDAIADGEIAGPLARFLDRLDQSDQLARTILFNLNPRDNELIAALIGCFQDGSVPGKMQYGPAWWFLDQRDGMEAQLRALSNLGLLSCFVGMVTDSRSFLSYSRHDYFRRLLCTLLGEDVRRGLVPDDRELLGEMVRALSFENARDYFAFELGTAADPAAAPSRSAES